MKKLTAYGDRLSVVRATDSAAVVHHVQSLIGYTFSVCGTSLRKPSNYHVGITYCFHLERGERGRGERDEGGERRGREGEREEERGGGGREEREIERNKGDER